MLRCKKENRPPRPSRIRSVRLKRARTNNDYCKGVDPIPTQQATARGRCVRLATDSGIRYALPRRYARKNDGQSHRVGYERRIHPVMSAREEALHKESVTIHIRRIKKTTA